MVTRIRRSIPEITAIYAYGSRVHGGVHPGSDLDLALLLPPGCRTAPDILAQLQGDLESLAGFPVEISILSPETQVVHCKEVVAGGKVIFSTDPDGPAGYSGILLCLRRAYRSLLSATSRL